MQSSTKCKREEKMLQRFNTREMGAFRTEGLPAFFKKTSFGFPPVYDFVPIEKIQKESESSISSHFKHTVLASSKTSPRFTISSSGGTFFHTSDTPFSLKRRKMVVIFAKNPIFSHFKHTVFAGSIINARLIISDSGGTFFHTSDTPKSAQNGKLKKRGKNVHFFTL